MVLFPMLVWVLLPFAAPVAMYAGADEIGELVYTLYLPFCHQLPQRSWFFFGEQFTYTLPEIAKVYPTTDPSRLRFFYGTPDMGWRVAWSDRMISFYTMTPIFGLAYGWFRTRYAFKPLHWASLLLLTLPLLVDGITHAVSDLLYGVSGGGFRDTNTWLALLTSDRWPDFYAGDHFGTFNWWMRLVTGILAAWGFAFWAFPWLEWHLREQ